MIKVLLARLKKNGLTHKKKFTWTNKMYARKTNKKSVKTEINISANKPFRLVVWHHRAYEEEQRIVIVSQFH